MPPKDIIQTVDLISGTDIPTTGSFWSDCPLWCNYKLKYFGCACCLKCCKRKQVDQSEGSVSDSEDNEDTEFVLDFSMLSTAEKETRLIFLWQKIIKKAISGVQITDKFKAIQEKIKIFGTQMKHKKKEQIVVVEEKPKWIIYPQNPFR